MKRIPDSELELMMMIWEAEDAVTSEYLMQRIERDWTKTTVLNLLSRLCKRGFLECGKEGRHNIYRALVDKDEYLKTESRSFLKRLYHDSLTKLVASLYDGKSVTREDLEELKAFIEEQGNG